AVVELVEKAWRIRGRERLVRQGVGATGPWSGPARRPHEADVRHVRHGELSVHRRPGAGKALYVHQLGGAAGTPVDHLAPLTALAVRGHLDVSRPPPEVRQLGRVCA